MPKLKSCGFKVKPNTNGSFPNTQIELVDNKLINHTIIYKKSSLSQYISSCISGIHHNIEDMIINIYESIKKFKDGNIDHEFRSTLVKAKHNFDDIYEMASYCLSNYKLQLYNNKNILDKIFSKYTCYTEEDTFKIIEELKTLLFCTNISYQ